MKQRIVSGFIVLVTIFSVIATAGINVAAQEDFFAYPDANPYWALFRDDSTDSPYVLVTFNATSDGGEIALMNTGVPVDGVEIRDDTYYVINASAQSWEQAASGSVHVDYSKLLTSNVRIYDEEGYLIRRPYDYETLIDEIAQRYHSIDETYGELVGSYEGTYTAPQGLTGMSFAVYRTSALLSDTAALTYYARVASLCSRNEDGSPKQIFSADDIKSVVSKHEGEYIALFNYYPTTANPDVEEGTINPYGVIVNTNGHVEEGAVLQVFRVNDGGAPDGIGEASYELYNISFVSNDTTVQPNGKVKVYLPIPNGLKKDTCTVYRQEPSGLWMALNAKREGNYLVFETAHFSLYAVVGEQEQMTVAALPERLAYTVGDVLDCTGLALRAGGETVSFGFVCVPSILDEVGEQTVTVRYGNMATSFTVTVAGKVAQPSDDSFGSEDTSSQTEREPVLEDDENVDSEENDLLVGILVGAGIVVIALGVVVVCLVRNKKKKKI